MQALLEIGLSNAVMAAGLALLAAGAGRLLRRPALTHKLWLLVLLKLITPPLLVLPFIIPETIRLPGGDDSRSEGLPVASVPTVPGADAELLAAPPTELAACCSGGLAPAVATPADEPLAPPRAAEHDLPAMEPTADPPAEAGGSWPRALIAVWLAGTGLWLGLTALRVARFRRALRCARPAPAEMQAQADELAAALGLARRPQVWLVPGTVSPLLWGLGRATRLILPVELLGRLDAEQWATLLAHELAHVRRGDPWVRLVELIVTGLFWWHPVVWWARSELRAAEEECCDAWVVWALPAAARAYALALLEAVEFLSEARPALPPAASGDGHVRQLRRRLTMIMRSTTPRALSWVGFLGVFGRAVVLLPMLPTWAQEEPPAPADPLLVWRDEPTTRLDRLLAAGMQCEKCHLVSAVHPQAHTPCIRADLQEELKLAEIRVRQLQDRLAQLEGRRDPASAAAPRPASAAPAGEDVQQLRDLIERLQLQLRSRQAQLAEAQVRYELAQNRLRRLQVPGVSAAEMEQARADVEIAKAQFAVKQVDVEEVELLLKQAQRRLKQLEERQPGGGARPPAPATTKPAPSGMPPGTGGGTGPVDLQRRLEELARERARIQAQYEDRINALQRQIQALTEEVERLRKEKALPGGRSSPPPGEPGGFSGTPGRPGGGLPGYPGAPGVPAPGPSAPEVGGQVKTVGEGGLVVISIGSDAGLRRGDRLEVYRLEPKPVYLGQVTILEVNAKEAVGRVQAPAGKEPIRPGDQVVRALTPAR